MVDTWFKITFFNHLLFQSHLSFRAVGVWGGFFERGVLGFF